MNFSLEDSFAAAEIVRQGVLGVSPPILNSTFPTSIDAEQCVEGKPLCPSVVVVVVVAALLSTERSNMMKAFPWGPGPSPLTLRTK
jgi:hypothetical protein